MKAFWEWLKSLFARPPQTTPQPAVPPPIENVSPVDLPIAPLCPLSWEKNHTERFTWSVRVYNLVDAYFSQLDQAKDIVAIRPDYASLSPGQKRTVWCELFSAIAYYECGWGPKAVAKADVAGTDSIGLLQLSVEDQESYKLPFGYNATDLQDPSKNLRLGVAIMAKLAVEFKKIIFGVGEHGLYWATLHPGGKNDKTASIKSMVQKLSVNAVNSSPQLPNPPLSNPAPIIPPGDNSEVPARKWFLDRLGWTEFDHDKELSKGWALTHECKDYTTVIGDGHAWCGMSLATALHSDGYDYPLDCEAAAAWDDYGIAVDWKSLGIKLGDIICIRHASGGRHVTTAYRDHAIGEMVIDCLGGNQGDSICVKRYQLNPAVELHDTIVTVRRPVKA